MRSTHLLPALLTFFISSAALAQTVLTSPDLTSLVSQNNDAVTVTHDRTNARYYINGSFTSVNGVPKRGVARVYPNGVVDLDWHIQFAQDGYVSGIALAPNGDVFVAQYNQIKRYKSARTAEFAADVTIERTPGYSEAYVAALFTDASGTVRAEVHEHQPGVPPIARCLPLDPARNAATDVGSVSIARSGGNNDCKQRLGFSDNESTLSTSALSEKLLVGDAGSVKRLLRLEDGGFVAVGDFAAFENGIAYKNLLRFDAAGRIVPALRLPAGVTAHDAQIDGNQLTVFGRANNAPYTAAYSLASNQQIWVNTVAVLFPNARGDYFFGFDSRESQGSYRQFRKDTGLAIPGAIGNFDSTERRTVAALNDGQGSLWVTLQAVTTFGGGCSRSVRRFSLAPTTFGAESPIPSGFLAGIGFSCFTIRIDDHYVYSRNGRIDLRTNAMDPNWSLDVRNSFGAPSFTENYVYWIDRADAARPRLVRANKQGGGAINETWQFRQDTSISYDAPLIAMPSRDDPDRFAIAGYFDPGYFDQSPRGLSIPALIASTRGDGPFARTVVEYYAKKANRYFITGRADEKVAFDARPDDFARTGMEFAAVDATYRNYTPLKPVCRFYASPLRGASNTHYYGAGDECAALKVLPELEFESYDFSVTLPTNGACPSDAPFAVTRLFNNRAATNDANHRYVVSAATKAAMLAQGWIDEGVRFCATSGRDVHR
jgi:hypothetical protein